MYPNVEALTRAFIMEKARTDDCGTGEAATWCRQEYGPVVRHG